MKSLGTDLHNLFLGKPLSLLDTPPSLLGPQKTPFSLAAVRAQATQIKSMLNETSGPKRGSLICLIGKPGIGKSSFAQEFPDPDTIIEPRDQGVLDLAYEGLIRTKTDRIFLSSTYGAYLSNLSASINGTCKTIICESLKGLCSLCNDHCSATDHGGDYSPRSFLNFQQGPIQAAEKYFQALIDMMLRAQNLGKHVILIGHSRSVAQDNKTGEDWLADTLECDKRVAAIVHGSFTNIFHIVDAVPTERRQGKTKATSGTSRWMYVNVNPHYLAKNRMGLVGEIEFPSSPKAAYLSYCSAAKRDPKTGYKLA